MPKKYFVYKDIGLYINYISEVKNLSKNTSNSYQRDLRKLSKYLESINIATYHEIDDAICSGWLGITESGGKMHHSRLSIYFNTLCMLMMNSMGTMEPLS